MEKINWLEWSKDAFEKAKKEDKPILLDIHGVWCHWCHVMDNTSYSDEIVIETVNKKFIPIRADTDKRPDINERYNQGGWPTTAFLAPDGTLLAGATYVPPAQLAKMLEQVSNYYARNKNNIKLEFHQHRPEKGEIKSVIDEITDSMAASFDAEYGGFGVQPKFPFSDAIEIALLNSSMQMATKTLDNMLGIFDNVAGGFFRYSVTRSWDQPHYEKMLESNAQLIANYLHAYILTNNEVYRQVACKTAEYLVNTLHGPDGFYGSQDADGEEKYYGKSLEERKKLQQPYSDKNIYVNLNAAAVSALLRLGTLDKKYQTIALKTLDDIAEKCYSEQGMCHYYDGKQNMFGLFSDNIYFVRALLDAYETTSKQLYLERAEKIMDFLVENFFDQGFLDKIKGEDEIGLLAVQNRNINDNSIATGCLMQLAFYAKANYLETANAVLEIFAKSYAKYGLHAASYAIAVEKFLNRIEISVSNMKCLQAIHALHDPRVMIKLDNDEEKFAGGYNIYICHKEKCMRFKDVEDAKKFLLVIK